jgi:hypothetical protein
MKLSFRAISALLLVAFLATPFVAAADQIAAPLERSVMPGVTTITYANQTLVFTTATPLRVQLKVVSPGHISLRFKAQQARVPAGGESALVVGGQTVIFWEQAGAELFNGEASNTWTDVPLTEGGWTEK